MSKKKIIFGLAFLLIGLAIGALLSVRLDVLEAALPLEGFRMEDAIINVADTTGRAVVSISIEHTTKIKGGRRYYFGSPFSGSPFGGGDDVFRKFFDDFSGEIPDREFKQMGLGSGVIIDAQGHILTNEHVIDDADKITVTLPDGRVFKGEVKGKDQRSDLAVIKINAGSLPFASLGDSDTARIGQWVVAIGNPFGFAMENPEPTVTVGVISALHRTLGGRGLSIDRDYNDLIQTDAAINPGNSGGPLVNLKGEVVGINVAIFSTTGGYEGIGFAIPINNAKRIISRLTEGKRIVYGWLGVTVQNLTEGLAKYFALPDKNGVLVAKVLENSPAQKAGIKESDVIKSLDDKAINNVRELLSVVGKMEQGRKVKVGLLRDKKELSLQAEIGERPESLEEEAEGSPNIPAADWRGLEVQDLGGENTLRFRIQEKKGVLVVGVRPNSPAEEAGIMPSEVIVEINKQAINNLADYGKVTQNLKGDALVRTPRGYFLIKSGE